METTPFSSRPRILLVCDPTEQLSERTVTAQGDYELVPIHDVSSAIEAMKDADCAGIFFSRLCFNQISELRKILQMEQIMDSLPCSVVVLGLDKKIQWANMQMAYLCGKQSPQELLGLNFYKSLGGPLNEGPVPAPLDWVIGNGTCTSTYFRFKKDHLPGQEYYPGPDEDTEPDPDDEYYMVNISPLYSKMPEEGQEPEISQLLVTMTDVTASQRHQKKKEAIVTAMTDMVNLDPKELLAMSPKDRINLLTSCIIEYTEQLLNFDRMEVRLLDPQTKQLNLLLSKGMDAEEENLVLFAKTFANGISGKVAATGVSYLCENPQSDPLYIQGARGAKSSATVPITLNGRIIGTYNVESLQPNAFDEFDLKYLELFATGIANALNTLNLLQVEMGEWIVATIAEIESELALPIDGIINDVTSILHQRSSTVCEGSEELFKCADRILDSIRGIKQTFQQMYADRTPKRLNAQDSQRIQERVFADVRILLADNDESLRKMAHVYLDKMGAILETAESGDQALTMLELHKYDAVIYFIRMPDLNGIEFVRTASERNLLDDTAVVLLADFGYDPAHCIPQARAFGVMYSLYKPINVKQLTDNLRRALDDKAAKKQ